MTRSKGALICLALLPNVGWIGFIAALGVWRAIRGEPPMAESSGPMLIGVGVFFAIACPFLANYLRPHPLPAA